MAQSSVHPPALSSRRRGDTALTVAASQGHDSIVELLLKHRADIEARNNDGPGPGAEERLEASLWSWLSSEALRLSCFLWSAAKTMAWPMHEPGRDF